ncbi:hypothetical protein AAE478_000929 [Parahypoxylon ruwenzoriense]
MASDTSRRRAKSGALPAKFKGFVHDMKRLTIHRHEGKKSQGSTTDLVPVPVPVSVPVPVPVSVPELPQAPEATLASRSSLPEANLAVQVTITFDEPLSYAYSRNYETSPSLQATEALCQGLLRRIDHCCYELITRKDSTAMEYAAAASGPDKPLRFEIQIDIIRGWSEVWASRTFKSYQKQPLSIEAAREVIISTHYIVGLFLRHHDDGFVWKDGPVRDEPLQEPAKFLHRAGRVQPMSCVPRSCFLEKSQSFESIPGYTINFSFTNRCHRQKPPEWQTEVEVKSRQTAPLNSIGAENVFFEVSYALERALKSERDVFENLHRRCVRLDGCKDCRHHDGDNLELRFSIVNNLGPQFPSLERTIHCNSNLSFSSQAEDCLAFVDKIEAALARVRDDTDDTIEQMNDLEFRITELRAHGWSLDEPLVFVLDRFSTHSQRDTEAILDRIQAGVADILRGIAISIRMTAYKRGHFILDKTFVSREPFESAGSKMTKSPQKSKAYVLDRLRQRVERDIEMLCKDTCTLDDENDDESTNAKGGIYISGPSAPTQVANSVASSNRPWSAERVLMDTTGAHEDFAGPTSEPKTSSAAASISKSNMEKENTVPTTPGSTITRDDDAEASNTNYPPSPVRQRPAAIFYSEEGARAFPLIPGLDDYVEPEGNATGQDTEEKGRQQTVSDRPASETSPEAPSALTFGERTPNASTVPGEELPQTRNPEGEQEMAPVYEPSIASTPSLVFGCDSSPSSSFLITPKKHRMNAEVDYSKDAAVFDSDDEGGKDSEAVGPGTQHDISKGQPPASPALRHVARRVASSPLRRSESVQQQGENGIPESGIVPLNGVAKAASLNLERRESLAVPEEAHDLHIPMINILPPDASASTPTSPENKQGVAIDGTDAPGQHVNGEVEQPVPSTETAATAVEITVSKGEGQNAATSDFAQTKPDFDLSCSSTEAPEGSSEKREDDQHQHQHKNKTNPSPPPSEDFDFTPSSQPRPRRSLQSQRGSFGSAGYLGFHEQSMFGSVDLRTALMRSQRGSALDDASRTRPGTAM